MNIFGAINAVMKDCGFIGKDSFNPQQKYKFRGIDAVMNALTPALQKNKVFVVPEVLEQTREERTTQKDRLLIYSIVKVKYTFYTDDGSFVTACVFGEGMDSGDKATNKAMSAAFKYACFQVFCIPTEEMKDSEDDSKTETIDETYYTYYEFESVGLNPDGSIKLDAEKKPITPPESKGAADEKFKHAMIELDNPYSFNGFSELNQLLNRVKVDGCIFDSTVDKNA